MSVSGSASSSLVGVLQSPHSKLYGTEHPLVVQHSHTNRSTKRSKDGGEIGSKNSKAGSCSVGRRCGESEGTTDGRSVSTHSGTSKSHHYSPAPGSCGRISSNCVRIGGYAKTRTTSSRTVVTCGSKDSIYDEQIIISSKENKSSHIHSQHPVAELTSCSLPRVEANSPHIAKKTTMKYSISNSCLLSGRGNSTANRTPNRDSRGRVKGSWMRKNVKTSSRQSCKVSTGKCSDSRSDMEASLLSETDSVSTVHLSRTASPHRSYTTTRRLPSGRHAPISLSRSTVHSPKLSYPLNIPRQSSTSSTADVGWSQGRQRQLQLGDIATGLGRMRYRNIIVMSGAGISTASGIPDFRTPGTGLYDNLQKYNLPEPSAVFDTAYFHHNPRPFFSLAKELYPGKFSPNLVHCFVRLLQDKGVLLRNYTQNIDGLERLAGVQGGKLVEAHGSFSTASCTRCHSKQDQLEIKRAIFSDQIPKCRHKYCDGVVKPDIVFFGEDLPQRFHSLQLPDFSKCDLLLVMGTSLEVEPFASLVTLSRYTVPRLLLNRELVGPFRFLRRRHTDVAAGGDIVGSVRLLVQEAGWEVELEELQRTVCKDIGLCEDTPPHSAACSRPAKSGSVSTQLVPALQRLALQQRAPSYQPSSSSESSSDSSTPSISSSSSDSSSC